MMPRATKNHAYKDLTLQQLRSFCETVHLGSLSAAAGSLGLSHPTVWKQVHSLEQHFGLRLVESHSRGCRPTDAGRALAELASPLVTGIGSLKQTLQEASTQARVFLTIAATQRRLVEDLPGCMTEFERLPPRRSGAEGTGLRRGRRRDGGRRSRPRLHRAVDRSWVGLAVLRVLLRAGRDVGHAQGSPPRPGAAGSGSATSSPIPW